MQNFVLISIIVKSQQVIFGSVRLPVFNVRSNKSLKFLYIQLKYYENHWVYKFFAHTKFHIDMINS